MAIRKRSPNILYSTELVAPHLVASPGLYHLTTCQTGKILDLFAGMAELQEQTAVSVRDLGAGPGLVAKPDTGPGICWVAPGRPGHAAQEADAHAGSRRFQAQVGPWS